MSGVLAVVPARSGSKGIPGKNIRPLAGRTLVARCADVCGASGVVDRAILTTDDEEIAEIGRQVGLEVPFLRPAELARDETPMLPVIQHAVAFVEATGMMPAIVLVIQPTSPLRRPEHLVEAVRLLESSTPSAVVSVVELPRHLSPDYVMRIEGDRLEPFLPGGLAVTRRQDARPAYVRDGTVYAVRRDVLMEQNSLYGRACRPLVIAAGESLTLDSESDWEEAERRLQAP
jgi:CMP-N-acetylneuraminic acid synthetase